MKKSRKIILLAATGLVAISLSGCSVAGNFSHDTHSNNYTFQPREITLHKGIVSKSFSVNYYDAHSDVEANNHLDNMVNSYLSHIRNRSQYRVKIRTNSASDDGDNNGNQVQIDTVVLTRK